MYEKEFDKKELAYDLRQNFAIITGEIKKKMVVARIEQDFPVWYALLDCLFIEVSKNLNKEEIGEYEKLKIEAIKTFGEHEKAYLKRTIKDREKVYNAIRKVDMWVNGKMNDKNMFGSKDSDDGL